MNNFSTYLIAAAQVGLGVLGTVAFIASAAQIV